MVRSHYDPPDLRKALFRSQCFFVSRVSKSLEEKRINFLALKAAISFPCYSVQPSCVKVRCRAFLMPACAARLGPVSVKNGLRKIVVKYLSNQGGDFYSVPDTLSAIPKDAVCVYFAVRQYSSHLAAEQRRSDLSFQG